MIVFAQEMVFIIQMKKGGSDPRALWSWNVLRANLNEKNNEMMITEKD